MEEVVLLEESFVRITFHPDLKMVKVVWTASFSIEQYQSALEFALDYQKKEEVPVENYLSNIVKQGIVNPNTRKWFEHVALPRATKQGLKRAAVVFDGNAFKKYNLNLILQTSKIYKLPLKFFNTEEEAINWFQSFQ